MLLLAIAWRLGLPKRELLFRQLWTALDTLARFMAFLLNMGSVASCLKSHVSGWEGQLIELAGFG